jgi:VWFA-related protein
MPNGESRVNPIMNAGCCPKRFVPGVLLIALSSLALAAQPPQGRQTFRVGTTLIEFTFVAFDGDGRPVTDLEKEEISIREGDRERPVAFFQFEGARANVLVGTARRPAPLPPGTFTNRPEQAPGPPIRNLTAIVLDAIGVSPASQSAMNARVAKYLENVPPGIRMAVYRVGDDVEVIHDFTDDVEALRERIRRQGATLEPLRPAPTADLTGKAGRASDTQRAAMQGAAEAEARMLASANWSITAARAELMLAGLEAVGEHLAAVPGRKSLVWVSEGLPTMFRKQGITHNFEKQIRESAQRLASRGVTLYPVNASGVRSIPLGTDAGGRSPAASPGGPPAVGRSYLAWAKASRENWASLDVLAEVTGGRATHELNDTIQGVTDAAEDLRGSYTLGFYAAGEPDDRWHELKVNVSRPGVTVRHRQGYLAAKTAADYSEEWNAARWRSAAYSPLGSSAIRIDARCELSAAAVTAHFEVRGSDVTFRSSGGNLLAEIDVAMAQRSSDRPTTLRHDQADLRFPDDPSRDPRAGLVRFTQDWKIDATTTAVRLIVRDRSTGRYGTLDVPIKSLLNAK